MGKPSIALLLAAIAAPAYSQLLSFGVKAGAQLTDTYSTTSGCCVAVTPYDRRYIIGPTAEVRLPLHLSFEADALYRRNGFTQNFFGSGFTSGFSNIRTRVNDWQFPFLIKWEPGEHVIRPFVDAGVSYRHVSASGFTEGISSGVSANGFTEGISSGSGVSGFFANSFSPNPLNANSAGATVGGGLTFKAAFLRLSPEIRYTHWAALAFGSSTFATTKPDQVDFLVGFTF